MKIKFFLNRPFKNKLYHHKNNLLYSLSGRLNPYCLMLVELLNGMEFIVSNILSQENISLFGYFRYFFDFYLIDILLKLENKATKNTNQ